MCPVPRDNGRNAQRRGVAANTCRKVLHVALIDEMYDS